MYRASRRRTRENQSGRSARGVAGRGAQPGDSRRTAAEVEQDVYADAGVTLDDELGMLSRRTFKRECTERSVNDFDSVGRRYLVQSPGHGSLSSLLLGSRASLHVMLPTSGRGALFPRRGDRVRIMQRVGSVTVLVFQVYSHPSRKTTGVLTVVRV